MEISITSADVYLTDKEGHFLYNSITGKNLYKNVYYIRIHGKQRFYAVEDRKIIQVLEISIHKYRLMARKCGGQLSIRGDNMQFDHYASAKEFYDLLTPWITMALIKH